MKTGQTRSWPALAIGVALLTSSVFPRAAAASSNVLVRGVIGTAGSPGTSSALRAHGTLGQPSPVGIGTAGTARLYSGFWTPGNAGVVPVPETSGAFPLVLNRLYQNSPNPFNPTTTIRYSVASDGLVRLDIFGASGHRLRTLVRGVQSAGAYNVSWDGRDEIGNPVASGVYFYRLTGPGFSSSRKMIVLK